MTHRRLELLHQLIANNGLEALVLNPGSSLIYLTGLHFHLMERPTLLIVKPGIDCALVLPELELLKIPQSTIPLHPYKYGDNPLGWQEVITCALREMGIQQGRIGVESTKFRFMEYQYLINSGYSYEVVSANPILENLRICKDADEINNIRKAVEIAQKSLEEILPLIKIGMTELEIASMLTMSLLRNGTSTELPFQPIVSSGPNSANPHAEPTDRKLQSGDMLLFDWGASYDGYISDLTRTFAVHTLSQEFEKTGKIVQDANLCGRKTAKAGISAGMVDCAARKIIEDSGYGKYFTHRLGHGIGMDGHEQPYIYKENEMILETGMCFTIEPGIYLPGVGGIRIEDNVVVTDSGVDVLSPMPRDIRIIA